ncbi:unnamed protein product [Symbiodinium sp. CCMP2592]|nr:unnamed protein product [Symbiodinium sp. CCMP2592]
MDRDPLHDSVLEEATEEGNESSGSAPTSPMTAAERAPLPDHVPLHAPPYGPPPPQPVNAPSTMAHVRARRTEPSAGSTSTSAGVDSMGIAATWPTRAPHGEAGDALAANILHHLQLTGPAYVRAPEYAEVATWRSLLISLREATPAEEYMLARTDPQDLNNALYDDNVDNGVHEVGGVETAPESEGRTDDPNTSEADSESDRDRTATRPPSATIAPALATTSIIAAVPPPSGHLPPDDSADTEPDATGTLYESEDQSRDRQAESSAPTAGGPRSRSSTASHDLDPKSPPVHDAPRATHSPSGEARQSGMRSLPVTKYRPCQLFLWSLLQLFQCSRFAPQQPRPALPCKKVPLGQPPDTYLRTPSQRGGPINPTVGPHPNCILLAPVLAQVNQPAQWCPQRDPVQCWTGGKSLSHCHHSSWSRLHPCRWFSHCHGICHISFTDPLGSQVPRIPCKLVAQTSTRLPATPVCAAVGSEARVAAPVTRAAGGASTTLPPLASAPKPSDLPNSHGLSSRDYSRCVKRAFHRACNRALQQGSTRYRGRTLRAQDVPSQFRVPQVGLQARPSFRQDRIRGLRVLSWNSGGLGSGLYPELMTYLSQSSIDIAIVVESRWTDHFEFTSGDWVCIHGGCRSRKEAGVLILIRQSLVPPSQLRYEHTLQGRITHIRLPLPGREARHLHIFGVYQTVHNPKAATYLDQRQQVWQSLHKSLGRVPVRDSILLAGDMNTPVATDLPHVGHHVLPMPQHPPEDAQDLVDLYRTFDLVSLNTWRHPTSGAASTFKWGQVESQIDFLWVRRRDATSQAKQAYAMRSFHVGASRQGGAHHFPLLCCLNLRRPHWTRTTARAVHSIDREALLTALDNPTQAEHASQINRIRQTALQHMQAHPTIDGIEQLHAVLYQACLKIFPKAATSARAKPWQTNEVQTGIRSMWDKWRAFKRIRKNGLRGWFSAWKAWRTFTAHHKQHQAAYRAARKQVLTVAMDEARQCAYKHDTRGIFQVVNRIAPKQTRHRLQLRDAQGHMLDAAQEVDLLACHFKQRFCETDATALAATRGPWSTSAAPDLDPTALSQQLMLVPRRKAVPKEHPPSAVWRCCADLVSPWLCACLTQTWAYTEITVPPSWADVDLALVPKPGKPGTKPEDHRPIGLSCPLGKKVLSCLVGPYIPQMLAAIQQFPQYAYQQGRAQYDALRRAFKHCASVREELGHHRRDLHARKAGHRPTPLFGALMLTLDLSQAFDRMPRHHLLQGMRDLQLPDSLVAVVMQWHSQIRYTVHHAGQSCTFPASRGIRQGCSASPLLWLVFSHVLCTQLAARIGKHKVDQILTVFADDHFAADSFHSLPEFEALLDCIVALFCTLEAFGMEVSDAKSKAVLALRGTLSNTITRRYVRKVPGGKVLRIQLRNRVLAIPLVSQFTYLGARVSYQAFENQTLQYRLGKGTATYNRLGSVLKGRHHLTAAQRIDLWKSCVWSSISYALPACGLTPSGHKTLETAVIKHLRAILRSPVHLTFTSNAEIAQQAGLELPHRMLQKLLQTEARRKSNASSPVDPFICTPADSWWKQVEESLQPPAESTTIQVPSLTVAKCACPICGITYALRSALLTHVAKQHPESLLELEQPTFDRAVDAIGGMPQCAACGKRFSTWQLLQRHVAGNYCAAKHELLPAAPIEPIVPASKRPALFAESPWPDLVQTYESRAIYHSKANEVYLQHCLVCGQWVASHKAMKLHYPIRLHTEMADQQIHEIFGPVALEGAGKLANLLMEDMSDNDRPSKHPKTDKRQRAPFAEPSGGGFGPRYRGQNRHGRQDKEAALIKAMGRLVIRQETQLQVLKQNSAWTLYLKPGQSGGMPILFKAAATYREASKTKFMEAPLRAVLLSTLFQTLLTCLQNLAAQPDQQTQAKTKGWLNNEGKWVYQRWDPENQTLTTDASRAAVTHQEIVNHVTLLVTAVTEKDVIHRFNATNGLPANPEQITTFLLEVGLRATGVEKVWAALEFLSNSTALQLCGMQLKRDNLKRSSLANDVQKLLQDYTGSA